MSDAPAKPLIVVTGVTASGKSSLAMDLAAKYGGEIICADSRTVYKEMNIGTAKPSDEDRAKVRHHMLDLIYPSQSFSAFRFKESAQLAMKEVHSRGNIPILVGGTGLYIDSIVYNFSFLPPADPELRELLRALTVSELQEKIVSMGLQMPNNMNNPRHLIRTLETKGEKPKKEELRGNTLVLGLSRDRAIIKKRIEDRVGFMFSAGLVEEARGLLRRYSLDAPGLASTSYRAFFGYFDNKKTINEVKKEFIRNDYQLARRQNTWLRRNTDVRWIQSLVEAYSEVDSLLN